MTVAAPPRRIRHANSFDALRLLAASSVMIGHAFPIVGRTHAVVAGVGFEAMGVFVFFTISGYLVTKSWMRRPAPGPFWASRALRIMPALLVVVLAAAFVVGPIATTLPTGRYLASPGTWRYVGSNLVLWTAHHLPGVFQALPYPHSINTSLWTLPMEVAMYAGTLVLAPLFARSGRAGPVGVVLVALGTAFLWDRHPYSLRPLFDVELWSFGVYDTLCYMPSYLLGSAFAAAGLDRAAPRTAHAIALASLASLALLVLVPHPLPLTLLIVPMALATLYLGLGHWLDVRLIRRIGDISYGTYLWGFMVQQLVVWSRGTAGGVWANVAFSLPIAWLIGFLSWRLIEQPALLLKPQARAGGGESRPTGPNLRQN